MKKIIKQPTYYSSFVCNGSTCEENCCGNWKIWIDKKHYKKLKNLKDKEIKYKLNTYVKRYKNKDTSYDKYAQMKFDKVGKCPFLTDEKLCGIQLKYGYDILSNVCKIYPRNLNYVYERIEMSLDISCPTAAEIILMNKNGIKFEKVEKEYAYKSTFTKVYYEKIDYEILMDIRIFCTQIMKSRDYEIWERLIILGLFIKNINQLFIDNNLEIENVQKNIIEIKELMISGYIKDYLKNIKSNIGFKIKFLKEILDEIFYSNNNIDINNRYIQCFFEFIKGLDYDNDFQKTKFNYKECFEKYTESYLKEKGYIFENFIVNYMFSTVFPLGDYDKLFDNYFMMILKYSLIEILLTGLQGYYKEKFEDKITLKLIQSFEKSIGHNEELKKHIYGLVKNNNFNTMAHACLLIKM